MKNSEDFFTIQNKSSMKCISINSSLQDNRSISTNCNNQDNNQLFEYKIFDDKFPEKKNLGQLLIHTLSGLCLTRTNPPRLEDCNAELNQLWISINPKKTITSPDNEYYLKFSNDQKNIEITNSTHFEDYTTKFFSFKSINQNINIENLLNEKCLGTNEEDIYDPKVLQTVCGNTKFQ